MKCEIDHALKWKPENFLSKKYEMKYINKEQLLALAQPLKKNRYGQYLIERVKTN